MVIVVKIFLGCINYLAILGIETKVIFTFQVLYYEASIWFGQNSRHQSHLWTPKSIRETGILQGDTLKMGQAKMNLANLLRV